MSIARNLEQYQKKLTDTGCKLIAVSKTKPIADLQQAYDAGQRDFGENKIQEMTDKYALLPKDIRWHMIGHVQRNKIKYMASFVHLIHGVDSYKLLKEINKQALKNDRVIDCLLQVHIATEDSKFGFSDDELETMLSDELFVALENVRITGFMGMATNTKNETIAQNEFRGLRELMQKIKSKYTHTQLALSELSMGMSGDFEIALQEGSTIVRVGSAIFGTRDYQ